MKFNKIKKRKKKRKKTKEALKRKARMRKEIILVQHAILLSITACTLARIFHKNIYLRPRYVSGPILEPVKQYLVENLNLLLEKTAQ